MGLGLLLCRHAWSFAARQRRERDRVKLVGAATSHLTEDGKALFLAHMCRHRSPPKVGTEAVSHFKKFICSSPTAIEDQRMFSSPKTGPPSYVPTAACNSLC